MHPSPAPRAVWESTPLELEESDHWSAIYTLLGLHSSRQWLVGASSSWSSSPVRGDHCALAPIALCLCTSDFWDTLRKERARGLASHFLGYPRPAEEALPRLHISFNAHSNPRKQVLPLSAFHRQDNCGPEMSGSLS